MGEKMKEVFVEIYDWMKMNKIVVFCFLVALIFLGNIDIRVLFLVAVVPLALFVCLFGILFDGDLDIVIRIQIPLVIIQILALIVFILYKIFPVFFSSI